MPSGGNFSSCNCGPDAAACESPTQPVATVGLCLADGTPIAVTVVRDCAGTVTSEGWIDLTSGTWNAGSPPAGTIACGDSRSIQVSGTFCDVDPMGGVLGLVLIEYSYAADGSIAAVRLVDAVTGETYTPLGEVTTCPAGVDAPERDLVQLCDTAEDGTVTSFVRDYQRDSVGQITGHADYDLGGAPYTPTGTVDVCQDCPTSYASECWQQVAAQVSYDNTAGGPCGSISPGSMPQCAGTWVMTSWIIDGVERVPSPVTFTANGCGGNPGQFHAEWAATLATIDPTSSWEAAYNETCLWYIRTTGVDPNKVYGDMVMYRTVAADQVFTLGPSSSRSDATFTKVLRQECDGSTSATWLDEDGQELAEPPTGDLTPCDGAQTEECASSVTVLRLCDLDPDVPPNSDGKRCAKPFLRHLVYDCSGALTETRDTTPDGVTPYTPVQVVDCGSGGLPAMVEVPWEVVNIEPDPASPAGRGLVFTLSPIDDPSIVGTVTVTTSSSYGTSSCPAEPPQYAYRNPTTYTFTPDQALRDAATYVRCDLIDFDTFEPITGLSPLPDRFGGTAYLDGTTVRPTGNDGTGEMYYDGPPATWTYRVGNTGGGNSCSMLSFAAVSLRAEGCCSDCGGSGGGDGSGRTVQEVCVIANAAPQDVMRWTRVIENDGATIYYLDESGARYDSTLPAGHQIVVCPAEEPEPCRESDTVLLCDLPAGDGSGEPTATDVSAAPYPWDADQIRCVNEHPGGGGALWTGGSVTIPARVSGALSCTPNQYLAGVAATLQADRPACDDGTVDITVSLTARNDGPSAAAANYAGSLRLHRTDTGERLTDTGNVLNGTPAGVTRNLTVTATGVPAELLESGQIVAVVDVESWDQTNTAGSAWTLSNFVASHQFAQHGCETQFLRRYVTDCQTGETVAVVDTTLDGVPYEVTGDVGQCEPAGGGEDTQPCQHCETLTLCDVQPAEPGAPDVEFEAIPLADLGPAGSYGDGSPVTGTLSNGVGYSVNVGEWGEAQAHYTFYPGDNPQTWSFDRPVFVRFGLRGLNVNPQECYQVPDGAVVESINPNHTWDEDTRLLCEIVGQSSAADESVFVIGPVTELPLTAVGSATGGRGPGLIAVGLPGETLEPGESVPFLRTICRDCDGQIVSVRDTALDGDTPYAPTGTVTTCAGGGGNGGGDGEPQEPAPSVDVVQLCDLVDEEDPVPFLRHLVYAPGATAPTVTDTLLDGVTPYEVTGTAGVCPAEQPPCEAQSVLTECRWDDTDGDGIADTAYVELIGVACDGSLSSLGTYSEDLAQPYTPVSPVDPEEDPQDAPKATFVQAHRVELAAGASWDAGLVVLLQSVTATAHGGNGQITTADGPSTLYDGESVSWSVSRDDDTALTGPLTITAGPGTVTVSYTRATSS